MRVSPEWLPKPCGGSKRSKPATEAPRRASSRQGNETMEPSPITTTSKCMSVRESEFPQQIADDPALLDRTHATRTEHFMSFIFEDAHLPAACPDGAKARGWDLDDAFAVGMNHVARIDGNAADFDRLVDRSHTESAGMNRFTL